MDTKTYQELSELPEYITAIREGDNIINKKEGVALWSGKQEPPAIDSYIMVGMNGIGPCKVIGYFVTEDWLGILVKPQKPPEWYVKQNGYNATGHLFGAEIKEYNIEPPLIEGPTQEQLAALQRFATRNGRTWKSKLNVAWMDGKDEREEDGHLLRQVRNQFGPVWLHSKKNKVVAREV